MSATFPNGSDCYYFNGINDPAECIITSDMVNFLNLTTQAFSAAYFQAYCLNPPPDDGCPYGYCPNSDISGPLVRIAAYLTTVFVTIIIYYDPENLAESFWSQILTVYSFLITSIISVFKGELTRIHAVLATGLAGSPLSLYIFFYAIRSLWGGGDRMHAVLGRGKVVQRSLVLTSFGLWVILVFYILSSSRHSTHFSQNSCEDDKILAVAYRSFFLLPIFLIVAAVLGDDIALGIGLLLLIAGPAFLVAVAWGIAIWRRRTQIWGPGEPWRFKFYQVWRTVVDNYPFLQFMSVVFVPMLYWIVMMELAASLANDYTFIISYGQILALFVTIPPAIQVLKMFPRLWRWFVDLDWVRFITFRRGNASLKQPGYKNSDGHINQILLEQKYQTEPLVLNKDIFIGSHSRYSTIDTLVYTDPFYTSVPKDDLPS